MRATITQASLNLQVVQDKRVGDPTEQIELRFGVIISIDLFQYNDVQRILVAVKKRQQSTKMNLRIPELNRSQISRHENGFESNQIVIKSLLLYSRPTVDHEPPEVNFIFILENAQPNFLNRLLTGLCNRLLSDVQAIIETDLELWHLVRTRTNA